MVKFKGVKVSPVEIEAKLVELEAVSEATVFATHITDTELIFCVSTNPGIAITSLELEQKIKSILPKSQHPSFVFMFSSLPKNNNGKIDKKKLQSHVQEKLMLNKQSEMSINAR